MIQETLRSRPVSRVTRRLRQISPEGRAGLRSLGWVGFAQAVGLAIRLVSNILLTRILSPDDYGLLGSAMAVLTVLEWVSDLGIQPALIRSPRGSEPAYLLTGWWMGLGRGLTLTTAAVLLSMPYARFAGQPALAAVLAVMAQRQLILALRSPGMPALRKALNYRAVFVEEITTTAAGTVVSLAVAYLTHSVWAIVAGSLAGALSAVAVTYLLSPFRPRLLWDRAAARDIGHLGRQVFFNTLVMAVWLNIDRLVGLKYVSLVEMGFYTVAWNLASIVETLAMRGCDVYFSMLSRREGPDAQAAWHQSLCSQITRFALPVGAVAVVVAPLAVYTLYDTRYRPVGPLFAILIARQFVRILGQLQFQLLLARAEVHLATRAYFVAMIVQAALFAALVPYYGAKGMALAAFASATALTFVQSWQLTHRTGWGLTGFASTLAGAAAGLVILFVV